MRLEPAARAVALVGLVGLVGLLGLLGTACGVTSAVTTPTPSAAGAWSSRTVAGMDVRVYVPSTAPAIGDGRALMISLHGCTQTNRDFETAANWAATADEYGMVVALPTVPDGGVYSGCWDYYGRDHSRSAPARHDDNLLTLAQTLTADAAYDVDPDQVYLSGLSSGASETMVMGCLAPDVFAGIGINAGPTVGTAATQTSTVATDEATARRVCTTFSAGHEDSFATQLTSIVYGSNDVIAAPAYNVLNAHVMAGLYGATSTSPIDVAAVPGSRSEGTGTLYCDARGPRVSIIDNTDLGHAWPAGAPPGGTFLSASSIDYPAYLTSFLFANNRRVSGGTTPTACRT